MSSSTQTTTNAMELTDDALDAISGGGDDKLGDFQIQELMSRESHVVSPKQPATRISSP